MHQTWLPLNMQWQSFFCLSDSSAAHLDSWYSSKSSKPVFAGLHCTSTQPHTRVGPTGLWCSTNIQRSAILVKQRKREKRNLRHSTVTKRTLLLSWCFFFSQLQSSFLQNKTIFVLLRIKDGCTGGAFNLLHLI